MKFLVIIISVLISVINCAKFPSDIPHCRAGETKCIQEAINEVLSKHAAGHEGLYLPQIDPLHFDKMDIVEDGNRPVNIKLYFKNVDFIGMKNSHVSKVVGFDRDLLNSKFELHFIVPRLEMIANYEIDGRVLVLPIVGKGKSNITMIDNKVVVKFQAIKLEKNGKVHAQIGDKFKLSFESKRIYPYLANLFNGDKALSDNMNLFLSENWQELYKELNPAFIDAFSQVCKVYVNRILQKFAYEDIFP